MNAVDLSEKDIEAMEAMPDDLPERLLRGEYWDGRRYWTARDAVQRMELLERAIETVRRDVCRFYESV